ncbi:PHD finger protein 20-like protein 1 isoform X2 [Engraulis encrasicolus]|uniref:PHD finger protein 20-like protein 1 isoform X2 n=1 Tax=Engraulis encrasicolus TaxID=184585 RepID=UPI002FD4E900
MSKKPPCRPGIIFEVGAKVEAQDYLQKWYTSRIEKIDYDEGKMLVHFDRWSHRYDEWIFWDSNRLRPLERAALRKEGLKEEEEMSERLSEMRTSRPPELPGSTESTEDQSELPQLRQELRDGEEVLARWTDCRYYPAKIETVNKEGTYTVQFYDGVIRCVKRIHIKSMPEDAKGQDWIALVKAATAAAKSRGGCRPRTSLNSNKNKEDHTSDCEETEDKLEEEEDPESERLDTESAGEEDCKSEFDPHEAGKVKRRRRQSSVCHSKRPRIKQAGCSEEEMDCKSEQKEVPITTQQRAIKEEHKSAEHPSASLSTPSPARLRTRRLKHDSGESCSSQSQRQGPEEGEASRSPASSLGLTDAPHTDKDPGSSVKKETSHHSTQAVASSVLSPTSSPLNSTMATTTGKIADGQVANHIQMGAKSPLPSSGVSPKVSVRTPKANKHAREPIMNTKRSEDPTSLSECIDLDHNKFKCHIPGCSKAFRKAKLLDYHLKYYHNAEKDHEGEVCSPDRVVGRTRATSASMPTSTMLEVPDNKRRRTVSTSSCKHSTFTALSSQSHSLQLEYAGGCLKPSKFCKKKRSSASVSSDSTEVSLPLSSREKVFESLHDKILKKVIEKDTGLSIKTEKKCQVIGRKKEKDKERKERKEKDPFKIKQKKKKKKKKKSRQHGYSELDDMSLSFLERSSPSPVQRSSASAFNIHPSSTSSSSSKHNYPRAILSIDLTGENLSDIDFLEDSTTESLLLSGDEYTQDLDDFVDEEEDAASNEIVRCICEMDEENGFMIQCEECMCWQHSVCMGLLEDSIPDQYICYVCRDPPGQRWSAKYRHDKEWLNKGHMYGLSFLAENYSHQNAKKIMSTHQLLADVYSVKKVLHGLQLKMDILQNKHNPSLHLWARSWVNSDEEQPMGGAPDCIHYREHLNQSALAETYITSEHSYQKPPGTHEHGEGEAGLQPAGPPPNATPPRIPKQEEEDNDAICLASCIAESCLGPGEQGHNCLQWQMNLLTHIEDVQNQVAGRMDLIEKELDVLESWLDFTGELEPPDPLGRLPQLKCRIKQLLNDLAKVQQMSTLCSV